MYGDLVSIIMPAYNAEEYILESVYTVLDQTYSNWELIIVDDCSTDNTSQIILELIKSEPRIRLIKLRVNQGVANARNVALDSAKGRYIAFLDSDDLWKKHKLEHQIDYMATNMYVFSYTRYQKFSDKTRVKGSPIKIPKKMKPNDILKNTAIACLTVIIDREAVGVFHMPDMDHSEDQVTWKNILDRGFIAHGLNEDLALYREREGSLTHDKKEAAKIKWNLYRKYYGFSFLRSFYYFGCYSINAIIKHFVGRTRT